MAGEIFVPTLGESVTEATIAKWYKSIGDPVHKDEILVELETDKVTLEISAQISGKITDIKIAEGENVEVGAVLGIIEEGEVTAVTSPPAQAPSPSPAAPAVALVSTPSSATAGPAAKKNNDRK